MLASDSSSSGVIGMIPALLTRTSIGPRRRSTSSRKALKPARSVTSSPNPTTASPSSAAVRSAASRSTSPIATRTPLAIRASVIARPMPLAPPVTTAVLPLSWRGCLAIRFGSSSEVASDATSVTHMNGNGSEIRAVREVGREGAHVAAREQRPGARGELEPGLHAGPHGPALTGGDPLHDRLLAAGGGPGQHAPQHRRGGVLVRRGEQPQLP